MYRRVGSRVILIFEEREASGSYRGTASSFAHFSLHFSLASLKLCEGKLDEKRSKKSRKNDLLPAS
jgi:hypothetical protein